MPSPWPAPLPCRWCRRPCCDSWPSSTGCSWDKRDYAEFAGALGTGTLVRAASTFGVRQLVKLIPVYGQTAGAAAAAAASFAATYAMGKAASYFLAGASKARQTDEVASVYTRRRCATPSTWPRSATSAPARREPSREPAKQSAVGYSRLVLLAVALLLPAAEPHPAGQPLAVAARLYPLLGARQLHRRRRPSTTCRGG